MGIASLGFSGGPSVTFRIDPDSIQWNFKINTTVINTVAGRVVQVLGATLSDMTVLGHYGQNHASSDGESWKQAEAFANQIRAVQEWQSRDATDHRKMHAPATFNYSPKGWRFGVYIKALADSRGGSVSHQTGRFSYDYALTLFIVDSRSDDVVAGGLLSKAKQAAIDGYIGRISDGIGWHFSQFNGQVPEHPIGGLFGKSTFTSSNGAGQQQPATGLTSKPSAGKTD